MTSLNDGNGKDLVSYTSVPAVPPPPPLPKNFILEFENLVRDFDAQCYGFEALQAEWEKRNHPVAELPREFETTCQSGYGYIARSAKRLLETLQAMWSDENVHYHASRKCISLRLHRMAKTLPKGEQANPKSLVEYVEAELPSVMVLESTCREFETDTKPFPLPGHILPVLRKQKGIWKRRMESVDVKRIERLDNEYTVGREEQHAILEKAVRERLASAGHKELLAFLDIDKRVDECLHYVAAIANLRRENCTELAEKLQRDFETYQRLSNVDEDDESGDAWEQAESKARQTYDEARPVIQKKQYERECEERLQARKEQERQERKRLWEEEERRRQEEYWHQIELSQQIEDSLFTREAIAMFENNAVPVMTPEEMAEHRQNVKLRALFLR
jgi:hypothetical protein